MTFKQAWAFDTEWCVETGELVCVQDCTIDLPTLTRTPGVVRHARDPATGEHVKRCLSDPHTLVVGLWVHVDTWAVANRWGLWNEVERAYAERRVSDCSLREKFGHLARPGKIQLAPLGNAVDASEEEPDSEYDDLDDGSHRRMVRVMRRYVPQAGTGRPLYLPKRGLQVGMGPIMQRRFGVDLSEDKSAGTPAPSAIERAIKSTLGYVPKDLGPLVPMRGTAEAARLGAQAWRVIGSAEARKVVKRAAAARCSAEAGRRVTQKDAVRTLADVETAGGPKLRGLRALGLGPCLRAWLHSAQPWRMRYGELLDVPLSEWPEDAVRYAREDPEHTAQIWIAQVERPRDKWAHTNVKYAERLQPPAIHVKQGRAVHYSAEAERCELAYYLERTGKGGIRTDQAFVRRLHSEYVRVRDVAAEVLCEQGQAERRPEGYTQATWYKTRQSRRFDDDGAEEPSIMRDALTLFSDPSKEPSLTKKGLETCPELEGLPLAQWPDEARAYLSTAGHSLRRALADDTLLLSEDARALLKGGAEEAISWETDRIRAALDDCVFPGLLAYTLVTKAHAYAGGMIGGLIGKEIVHPRFQPLLDTGRLSLVGDVRQNMPRAGGIRECFIPRDGNVFIAADYSQIELVAFAWLLDQAREFWGMSTPGPLCAALNAGKDAHVILATDLLADRGHAIDYALGMDLKSGKGDPTLVKMLAAERQDAKALNYGLGANMSPRTFVRTQAKQGTILSLERAIRGKDIWRGRWQPDPYFDICQEEQERFVAQTIGGLGISAVIPFANIVRGGLTYTQYANVNFQGLCAEGFRRAFIAVWRACLTPGDALYGFRPRLPIHDEIVAEGPADRAPEALARMEEIMQREMRSVLPGMLIQTEGETLAERWCKSLKSLFQFTS